MTTEEAFPPIIRFQADDTTAFLRAARSGNLEKVIEFLNTDLDINTANSNGLNALHLASKDGHVEIVTELLKRGAKVDAATKKGNTALHIASLAGQTEIVNILIQYGAAVNIQSQNGFTPLYMAAQENHDQVVKLLLSNGANQSLATEDGFTPLAVAMQQGHDKVVSVLLENDSKGKVRLPALHIAAKKDDCKAADLLLQNDHKPDVTSKSGFTPLHIAAHYGNEEIARLLIKRGADVNYLAKHNISPLHVAAKWGKNNMVKVLLENSAQIDAKTRDGLTPLHCAARSGHEQVITTLLEDSAPISARTKNGLAPLHMASQGDHVDAARVLLYHRAPVDEVTVDYLTSLHVAAHCGHVRVAKLLLDRKADPNARALNGFTPLHIACKKNRIKVVELLLKHGASIESTTESGLTPLHVASFMGCMNIVIFLLQHEANPDVPTVRGETPLHLAARANQTDIIRILLRNGAKVDARAREQQTPLHIASRLGNIDIVMLLLQHGAAVDTTTKDMYTALHIAAKEGQEEVATLLVENNASLKATTKNGFTPLHIAAKYGNMSVANILLQRDSKLDVQGKNDISPLHLACHYDHPNVANLLLEKGASPHLVSQNGHTPLHIAARKNQMDIASTLLENGANANTESKAGFTPLHLSAQKGHYDMTNLLIEHGADPNHKSKNGLTALHLCAQEDFIKVASILVKNGANVESETETGYRPIHVAAHFGNLSMIRFLLKHNASIDVKTNQNYTPLHQAAQQGHAHIVSALIEGNASHKARTNDGLTALNIAQKLGYISVMEVLKGLSYDTLAPDNKNWDEKYKVIAPESLQETSFMSDSDDEGGSDALISEQPYRYLTADLMKSLRDDSLPIDVTRDDPIHRQVTKEEKQDFTQSNNYCLAENFDTDGFNLGRLHFRSFLVSFLVDARGGAMKGCRHSGVRIIVPPRRATMPIRVTCRLIKPNKVANPPPLMEGEALATRIIEMGPIGATFLGPVLIDIPHFASIRGKEREIIILRSENGETWKEHDNSADNDTTLLNTPHDPQMSAAHSGRITRIITTDFPQYFAIITRIKQEVHVIGAEGGILTSSVANDVQAVFPPGALTKKIKVGLQAHVIPAELTAKLLGNCVAVSPVITIEPRRRKFHKPITLTIPVPQAANKGMINQYGGETPTLRLLCSIAGGTSESQWEDVTGSTPLTFMNDTVSFTTTVSARFWLMDCRNIGAVPKMATELYEESLFVPYITNFVIYSKRMDVLEATLRILCMTDGKEGMHTLERQEEFVEIVKSRDVEALDGKDLYIEFSGNLVPVTKSGVQLKFTFKAFRQNRLSFHVKVKDPLLDPVARMLFMREPKVAKGEPPQQPICVLNIVLPEITTKIEVQKKLKDYEDSNIITQKLESYESKYKMEQKEKGDEPKDISPSKKKFITDTLEKERTDAVTIHEFLAQKAACSLESVDASYPSKVVEQEQDLSPSVERQTYSEKRKFWEDISKKRESYQRSESEVSRTSQLTINESDSEYIQNVITEDTADIVQQIDKSETLEDLNVPDISECSVAEKAQYFEEQIQKEITKLPSKTSQQDSLKSEKEKVTKTKISEKEKLDKDEKYVTELKEMKKTEETKEAVILETEEKRIYERKEMMKLSSEDEKEKDESKQIYGEVSDVSVISVSKKELSKGEEDFAKPDKIKTEKVKPEKLEELIKDQLVELKVEHVTKEEDETVVFGKVPEQDIVKDVKIEKKDIQKSIMELSTEEKKDIEEKDKDVLESVEVSAQEQFIDEFRFHETGRAVEKMKVQEFISGVGEERIQDSIEVKEKVLEVSIAETDAYEDSLKKSMEETKEKMMDSTPEVKKKEEDIKESIEQKKAEEQKSISEISTQEKVIKESIEEKQERVQKAVIEVSGEQERVKESIEEKEKEVQKFVTEITLPDISKESVDQREKEDAVTKITIKQESIKEDEEEKEQIQKVAVQPSAEQKHIEDIEKKQKQIQESIIEIEKKDIEDKHEKLQMAMQPAKKIRKEVQELVTEIKLQDVITESEVKQEKAQEFPVKPSAQDDIAKHVEKQEKEIKDVITDIIVRERVGTPEIRKEDIVREKSSGRRIITEETTIIYKVQKDGTLVQEQVLKSVQVEGGSDVLGALAHIPEHRIETKRIESITDIKPEITFSADIKKEMQKFLEGEKEAEIEVKDKVMEEAIPIEKEQLERVPSVPESTYKDTEIKEKEEESPKEEKEESVIDKKTVTELEAKHVKKEFESRIPISTTKIDKDKVQKETKPKGTAEIKLPIKFETEKEICIEEQDISPTTKKKEFESRIPKRVIDIKTTPDKPGKKDMHIKKESESYTITEKKSSEEVTSKLEEHLTTKSEMQTFSKTFTDPQEAFKMFEDMDKPKTEFATVTSKIDHKTSTMLEQKEVVSSEISSGTDKVITLEEKQRIEKKKSSESQLKKESPTERLEEKRSKREELDKTATQKMLMNLTDTQEVIDAFASESRAETKKEETTKKLSDKEGVMTHMAGTSILRESDADVAIRIKKDIPEKSDDKHGLKTVEGEPATERISKPVVDSDHIETLAQGESHKETKESFDVTQFVPSEKKKEEKDLLKEEEPSEVMEEEIPLIESLEEKQRQKFKEIEARTIAETLIQSIESEIEAKSAADLKAELLSKGYLEQIISESVETDHEKLADDLTRKFKSIMKMSEEQQTVPCKVDQSLTESPRLRSSFQEESLEKSSTRDSISVSEDITKDEETFSHEKDESFPLSSSQAKLQDREIAMSPSTISEQMDIEETIDIDTNELESISKPTLSPLSEIQRSTKSSSQMDLQRDFQSDLSFSQDKIVSEISGARVLEILEPGMDSQSREDSVDVPSLEMDDHKISEQTSRGIPSLHESAEMDSFERLVQERDITISPSTVSEDTNIDYSLVQESFPISMQREHPMISTRRADSFEIESPPLVSPKPKVRGLEIKPVDWMIGDEKIEISETLQPSQIFNQELEAYESMKKKERLSSLDGSTDHEQESGTKSSEDVSVIESMKETITDNGRGTPSVGKTKFTVIPVSEQDFENELVEKRLDISCQELVDTLQREYDAKTPIKEYVESIQREISSEQIMDLGKREEETLQVDICTPEERIEVATTTADLYIEKSSEDLRKEETKDVAIKEEKMKDEIIKDDVIKEKEIKDEVIKEEVIKDEVTKDDVSKEEKIKDEIVKDDMIKEEKIKIEVIKDDVIKEKEIKGEVIKKEEIKVEVIKEEKIKDEVIKEEKIKVEMIKDDVSKEEKIKDEVVKDDVSKQEKIKDEVVKDDVIKEEKIKVEVIKDDVIKEKEIKDEVIKGEKIKVEVIKEEKIKDKMVKNDAIKEEKIKVEVIEDGVSKEEKIKDEVVKDDVIKEEKIKVEVIKDDVIKEEKIKFEVIKDDVSKDEKIKYDASVEGKTKDEVIKEEIKDDVIQEGTSKDKSKISKTDKDKREEAGLKSDIELKLEKTTKLLIESEKPVEETAQGTAESDKSVSIDDVLKEWTEAYLSKLKPMSDEYKRHMKKAAEKHYKPGRSTTVPSDTCAFKIKRDDPPSVDLSARYAITVLDQVVKKKIAEVKESLEAAKQDLIEELSENSETVIQIKDSPSEFRFKIQPESIPNDLPFLYAPSFSEQTHESDTEAIKSESPIDKSMPYETKDSTESKMDVEESTSSSIEEPIDLTQGDTPVIQTEKSDIETAPLTVQEDSKDDEEEHPSPVPASMSGSDIDNKDESSSLALPRPVLRRRQKPGRSSKRVTSESDADLGSSSGESSNYQSCDYEIGSGSRPSSSDVEALHSCGIPSTTASEYETAMMSIEHSSSSKQTSQEYHTAATTMSSRESMKSLTSLSSGHLGSIDSTSELSETLVASEADPDKEEVEEDLDGALDEEHTEQSDSSGSDIPIDEPIDNIYSRIPCRMKRSSEMIFPQVLEDAARDVEYAKEEAAKEVKGVDFATSTSAMSPGTLQSVDIMTSRVFEDGVQSVCTQVISTQTAAEADSSMEKVESAADTETAEKDIEEVTLDVPVAESDLLDQKCAGTSALSESPEMSVQTSIPSMMQQASMSTSSTSGVSIDTVIEKEKSDRHSPDSDSFEMVDKPDIIDDFVVVEEVGKEAEEYDSEGKSIRISTIPQAISKHYDRDLDNLITETKEDSQVSTSQASKTNELFDFESEESPPQVSNDDQYSQSYSDDEQYEGGKKWMEMQFQADPRVYDIEYDRGPLEDIKEEEITDFEAGSSRFGSLGSHKESIGSVGSMRGSFGSTPDYDVLAGKKYFTRPSDHDNVSLSSLQEFEHLESAVAAENSKKLQCGSHDSVNNGSLPRRYTTSRSGHGDDISLSSLKDFEGLEKACREAHLIELRAREEEDLLEHESPENKYKLESLPRTRVDTAGSFNASTSGSDDYEKRIKEIDEIIRIAQSNVEKFDRQDDTTDDISQIEITDAKKVVVQAGIQTVPKPEEPETALPLQRESNVMETSTDSLELEDNMDKKHHPLCRSSDSLEMKTTLDFPSLSSDSLNNVRDAKEMQSDVAEHASSVRRISSDSLDMPLLEQQDVESHERPSNEDDPSDGVASDNSLEQRSETRETDRSDKTLSTNT